MTTGPLVRMLIVGALGLPMGSCSDSGDDRSGGSSGGISATGGSGSGGATSAGGTTSSGGRTGQEVTGGTTGGASSGTSGGSIASGGQIGAPGGGQPGTGSGGSGGTSGLGGGPDTGGRSGIGSGGREQTGGSTGLGGRSGTDGGTSGTTGGREQAGGTSGVGGWSGSGGQSGAATGGSTATGGQPGAGGRPISFGTLLDPQAVMSAAQELATSVADPGSSQWQAKGDQHRSYHFPAANRDEPYRLIVPTSWDGQSKLPLVMFLHGAGSNESTYLDQNNKQMINLAQEHGFILVSPVGDQGAYGNFLRLTAPFGDEAAAAELMSQVTADSERTNELSEQDVINVLELVLAEYPVDRASMFLTGHSMGSGGTWYIGGKYASYWNAIAPMSGPFVQKTGYPWDAVHAVSIFVTEGTQTPSLEASRLLRDWLEENGFESRYEEVNADHGGMVPLVLPDVFEFFESSRP